jgi:hypothetical protein
MQANISALHGFARRSICCWVAAFISSFFSVFRVVHARIGNNIKSCKPIPDEQQKAEHMAAPTNAADVKKALANSEPSTHGTPLRSPRRNISGRYWAKADNPLAAMNVRFRGKGDMG